MGNERGYAGFFERTDYVTDVCDTEYFPSNKRFSVFRDAITSMGMPWRLEFASELEFNAHVVSLELQSGLIFRANMSPVIATRTNLEVANSKLDGIYLAYIVSGEASVEQGGRAVDGASRGIMVFDGSSPVRVIERAAGSYDVLALVIPKTRFANLRNAESLFRNISVSAERVSSALSSCLASLWELLPTASRDELTALYDASAILLPTALGHIESKGEFPEVLEVAPTLYTRELLRFLNENIGRSDLSPTLAADHIGMSVRYVHRQFALNGTTFGTYVMAKRLECVRRDLGSERCRNQPIFAIAFRWGFKDLSTFIRAFKKRFGCTPREYRLKC